MKWILLLLVLSLAGTASAAWDLNDVSYVLPLPSTAQEDFLLRLQSSARGGDLLPKWSFAEFPELTNDMDPEDVFKSLRVIAVRLDPCFPLPIPQTCQRQVRLVWQPIVASGGSLATTVDTALHSFYGLTENDFLQLLKELQTWKARYNVHTEGLPLQIHPAWAQGTNDNPALVDFENILVRFVGSENLMRVTTMSMRGNSRAWAFMGVNIQNGNKTPIQIPRINIRSEAFANNAFPADHYEDALIAPVPQGDDTVIDIVGDSSQLQTGFEEVLRKELQGALNIENPRKYNSENMDCASCHAAQGAREWVFHARPDIGALSLWQSSAYHNNSFDLTNISSQKTNTRSLRSLGYFGSDLALNQRVINESAAVAEQLNQMP